MRFTIPRNFLLPSKISICVILVFLFYSIYDIILLISSGSSAESVKMESLFFKIIGIQCSVNSIVEYFFEIKYRSSNFMFHSF